MLFITVGQKSVGDTGSYPGSFWCTSFSDSRSIFRPRSMTSTTLRVSEMLRSGRPSTTINVAALPASIVPQSPAPARRAAVRVGGAEGGGVAGGHRDRRERREAGRDEELELMMQAFALHVAGVRRIGSRSQKHAGTEQRLGVGHGVLLQLLPPPSVGSLIGIELTRGFSPQPFEERRRAGVTHQRIIKEREIPQPVARLTLVHDER